MAVKPETPQVLKAVRESLGIGNDVTDAALEMLLSSKSGQDALNKIKAQPTGGGSAPGGGLIGRLEYGLNRVGTDINNPLTDIGGAARQFITGKPTHPAPATDAAPAPKKKAPAKPLPDPASAAANAPESPFTQLAQALASEYLGQVQQLMPLTSGSAIFGPQGETTALANQAANMIPGGGQWIQQQAAAEQKAAAPLQAAMNQVGEAQAQGALPYAGALANTGTANAQYLEAAPWQQILSELASETAYKAASTQGAAAFGLTPQNTPAFLAQMLQSHGLTGTAGNSGLQAPGAAAKGGAKSSTNVNTPQTTGTP